MVHINKQLYVLLVVLLHSSPRLVVVLHTAHPQFEGGIVLLTYLQLRSDMVQLVRDEAELVLGYEHQVYLLVRSRGVHAIEEELTVQSRNVERLSIEVNHYVCLI